MLTILRIFTFVSLLSSALSQDTSCPDSDEDFAAACYATPLPNLAPSTANRTIPWGTPGMVINSTYTCCSSLDEVRAGIDDVDNQLLQLLSQRAAYVREATRFKATLSTVDVPSRDAQVISGAVTDAVAVHLPQNIAEAVFTAIINGSVPFEECVFNSF